MLLTPTEMERLVIFTAAELARKRRARGVKLNHPEAVAFIADEILEGARDGRSVADLISFGATLLTTDDVLPGVMDLMPMIQVEAHLSRRHQARHRSRPDPSRHASLQDGAHAGEIIVPDEEVEINAGRREVMLKVLNTGDRPVQVGSHYHFFETNPALEFDRGAAFGMRLAVPAGTAVRFEPGESKEVALCEFGGTGELGGLNSLTDGRGTRRRSRNRRCAARASAASAELETNGQDAPSRLRRHVRARRPATPSGSATPRCWPRSSTITRSRATSACTAAARPCVTAWGSPPATTAPPARSTCC